MRLFALVVIAFLASHANSKELDLGLGQCRFGLEADGTYYQSDRPTKNYMTPRCLALAWSDRVGRGPLGWRVGFLWSDQIHALDNVATFFDADAFQHNLTCNNTPGSPTRGRGCIVRIRGHGYTVGLSLSGTYEYPIRRARLIGEAGLFFFRHELRMKIDHIDCTTCPPVRDDNSRSGPFTWPSPLLGVTLKAGRAYISARKYWPGEHRLLSLTDHSLVELGAGLSIPF